MVGNARGAYIGPYNSGRRDVLFRVLAAPDDGEEGGEDAR